MSKPPFNEVHFQNPGYHVLLAGHGSTFGYRTRLKAQRARSLVCWASFGRGT
jgi:hypothetical protein